MKRLASFNLARVAVAAAPVFALGALFATVPTPVRAANFTVNFGTLNVTAPNFNSLAITGVPANTPGFTWSQYAVNVDWASVSGSPYSNEARIAFSANAAPGNDVTPPSGAGAYTGQSPAATGSLASGVATNLSFTGSFLTPYTSGNPLNFWYRQTYSTSVATWSNVSVTLKEATTASYSGDTTAAPTWTRPNANGVLAPTALSTTATATSFTVQPFTVPTAGTYDIFSTVGTPVWDNYTFLYSGSFDSTQPLINCLIGNDDFSGTTTSGFTKALTAGTQYYLVTTGYSDTAFGAYSNSITGPGQASLGAAAVPEPGTLALLVPGLGALVGGVVIRRRKRSAAA